MDGLAVRDRLPAGDGLAVRREVRVGDGVRGDDELAGDVVAVFPLLVGLVPVVAGVIGRTTM